MAVVLHGGFWRDAYDRSLMDELCEDLSEAGWAAWNLEYRRLDTGGGWPATFDDVAAGIDHLGTVARPGLELGVVVAIGEPLVRRGCQGGRRSRRPNRARTVGHFEHLDPRSPAWRSVRDWLPL